jgi:DNA-binding CsgD family transcriptional regulator
MQPKVCFLFLLPLIAASSLFAQPAGVASRTDGVTVHYYATLHEAFSAAEGTSIDQPDEITLLADLVLDEPLTVADGKHIRLVAGGSNRTIHRSPNLIEFPVLWVNGVGASLTLGKQNMEFELTLTGGISYPFLEAHAPLVAVSGADAKLIMYDNVTLQNNINNGNPLDTSHYELGGGVFIRTQGDIQDRQAEFIMKGGTIRGNTNDIQISMASGGAVQVAGFGIFTMEGGVIMANTARLNGGGIQIGGRGTFKKTGGIVYGSNAPAAYRNIALSGSGTPNTYRHAVSVTTGNTAYYRNDTVGENDNLSYTGSPWGRIGVFGEGEKWDNLDKALRRRIIAIALPFLALAVCVFLIYRRITFKKLLKIAQEAAATTPETVFENVNMTGREREISTLLLTKLSMKQISVIMELTYATADYHARKLYRKLNIQGRTELLIKSKGMGSRE